MSARDRKKGGPQFYEQLYGIGRWSWGYWWPRLAERKILCVVLLLALMGAPFAGMFAIKRLGPTYHAFRADIYYRGARRFLEAGDPVSAKIELQNSYRHDPGRVETLRLYAGVLETLGDPEFFPAAIQAWLADPEDLEATKRALRAALGADNDEIASDLVSRVLKKSWRDAEIWLLASRFLLEKGHHAAAYNAAVQARRLDPDNDEARWAVATMAAHSNKEEMRRQGLKELDELRRHSGRERRASWWLASALARDNPEAALAVLDEMIAKHEDAWAARLRRIRIEHRIRPEKTPASLHAIWGSTTNSALRAAAAEAALGLQQVDAAGQLLASLDEESRGQLPFVVLDLRVLASRKEWEKVLELANSASARTMVDRDRAVLWTWTYKAHRELKDQSSAATLLRLLLNHCQDKPWQVLDTAQRLVRLGLPDEAAAVLALLADAKGPLGRHARWRLSLIQAGQGRVRAMLDVAEKSLAADPHDPQALNNVAACLLLLNQDPARALQLAGRAVGLRPERPHYRDTQARALAANGRVAEALAIYEKLPIDHLRQPDFRVNRAFVLMQAGRIDEARRLAADVDTKRLLPEQVQMVTMVLGHAPGAGAPAERLHD